MHCLICGYDLSRSPGDTCSECGTRFSPTDPSSYADTPSLLHRLLRHAPSMRERIVQQHTEPACRGCGASLKAVQAKRCPECSGFYNLDDPSTYLRALRGVPRGVLRFQHVAPIRGVLLPAILLCMGLGGIALRTIQVPTLWGGPGVTDVDGWPAAGLGVMAIGAAVALHAHYFWGRVEPWWRHAQLGVLLGAFLMIGGIVLATGIALLSTL